MNRVILHSDCNCFYASVEMLHHPELAGRPLAVGGDPEARHGIVLTANYIAKRMGVKTGMALWEARQACPEILFLPPRMDLYLRFSAMTREIYGEYSDCIEPFGCDEAWIDATHSINMRRSGSSDEMNGIEEGYKMAQEISARIKKELGITVSIGVSWNKIFAKFGSDYKKPDAITVISPENYRQIVWPLPTSDLLMVGRRTAPKLASMGIHTIGDIANTSPELLQNRLGKMGLILYTFANGWDSSPVSKENYHAPIKSIGNSTTTPRDLENDLDVQIILMALAESVSARLRKHGFKCRTVEISIRDNGLFHFSRQMKLKSPTNITDEIMTAAYALFKRHYRWDNPIRSLGVRGTDLVLENIPVQLDLFMNEAKRERQEKLDRAVDDIRRRFGYFSIQRAFMYRDRLLMNLDAKGDHTVHPVGFFHG